MATRKLIVYPNKDLMIQAGAQRFVLALLDLLAERLPDGTHRTRVDVALSGGSAAQPLGLVLNDPLADAIDWSRVHFWWSDERFVPAYDTDRNALEARRLLLDQLVADGKLPESNIHEMAACLLYTSREGQSVQTDVMIKRVDQLRLVNRLMTEATPERGTVPEGLYRYMIHFLAIESCVTSVFLILSRDPANYVKKTELWDAIDAYSPAIGKDVRSQLMSRALNLPGKTGRWIVRNGYLIAERIVGFN